LLLKLQRNQAVASNLVFGVESAAASRGVRGRSTSASCLTLA